jgi:ketosteroid isomerase-like protein
VDPTAVVERYLALIADPDAELKQIEALLDPDVRFLERPNLVSPRGSERDRAQMLTSVEAGRRLLRDQRFEVIDHLVDGDRVTSRVVWTGTIAVDAPPYAAESELRAHSSMHFTPREGRIIHQENFDCFEPPQIAE